MSTPLFRPAVIADLRFRSRHVHKTCAAFLEEKLGELGWAGPNVPFGTRPITFKEVVPDDNSNGAKVAENTVSISMGDLGEDFEQQLGGGFYEVVLPIFVDVYGASASIAQSIAEDIREQVTRGVALPVYDWSDVQNPVAVAGSYLEFENVVGPERPQASAVSTDFRKFWRVVKAQAHVFYGTG